MALSTLIDSLNSATDVIPDTSSLRPPEDGISLLDTKNELLLSYLQNLVFLIILKLQNSSYAPSAESEPNASAVDKVENASDHLQDAVVKKLAELRIYLEKGVRPLESKLKYQIDKVLRTADDVVRNELQKTRTASKTAKEETISGSKNADSDSDASNVASAISIDDLAYRPNPSALISRQTQPKPHTSSSHTASNAYRPPHITPTTMPNSSTPRPPKSKPSRTLSEYIDTELSSAPIAEPSIGSTILDRGRKVKSAGERAKDEEKRAYEEGNFVRLPKEARKKKKGGGQRERDGYGGEEWRGLGEGAERIEGLVGRSKRGVLERSRKRERERDGVGVGDGGRKRR